MKTKALFAILISIFIQKGLSSQSLYYYYKNNKVYINADKSRLSISSLDNSYSNTVQSDIQFQSTLEPESPANALTPLRNGRKSMSNVTQSYYSEVKLKSAVFSDQTRYDAVISNLEQRSDVVKVMPCFEINGQELGLTNKFYVKLNNTNDESTLMSFAQTHNVTVDGRIPYMPLWYVLEVGKSNSLNSLELANIFHESNLFSSAEPAFAYHDLEMSNDPFFAQEWGDKNTGQYGAQYAGIDLKCEDAWTLTKGAGANIAIFDHGFERDHPDLAANNSGPGFDATTQTSPSQVRGNHGTACAGIIGAVQNNGIGVTGVAPDATITSISIKLLFSDTPQQLASGFNYATNNGVDVISNSYGGYAASTLVSDAVWNCLTNGRNGLGTVICFSAGNDNNTNVKFPGNSFPEILVVGAMSPCGERTNPSSCEGESFWGSTYGPKVDVVAPGTKVYTTDNSTSRSGLNGYDNSDYAPAFNGTSAACPHIAGVAGLVLAANPSLTRQEVVDIIEQTAQKVRTDKYTYSTTTGRPHGTWNNEMGYGLANAYEAVKLAGGNYCGSASDTADYEYIERVELNTIDKTSGPSNYSNFAGETTYISKGKAYNITITPKSTVNPNRPVGFAVWVDYNQNDSLESHEFVWSQNPTQASPVSGTFTLPDTATNGSTGMRISMMYNGIPNACDTFTYGEVEDYSVIIVDLDTIAPGAPSNLTASNETFTTIDLNWDGSSDNIGILQYDIYVDNQLHSSVSDTITTLTGLTPDTSYDIFVIAQDTAGNISSSSDTITASTPADTIAPSVPNGLYSNNITGISLTLGWNAANDNSGTVAKYYVYQNNQLIDSSTTLQANITGLSPNTNYQFSVSAVDAAGNVSALSNAHTAKTVDLYCVSKGNSTQHMYINKFELGSIDNTSGAGSGYSDFTGQSTYLAKGLTHNFTITPGWPSTNYTMGYSIWIDYNNDLVFDASERIWSANSNTSPTQTGSFTIPNGAVEDTLRMRVSAKYQGVASPCETFNHGEVEDYSVYIGPLDSIAPTAPANLAANNIGYTKLDLSWDRSYDSVGVAFYEVYANGSMVASPNDTAATITGLTDNTTYDFFVIARDLVGNVSENSDTITVTTLADSISPTTPANLVASNVSFIDLDLDWDLSTDNDTVIQYYVFKDGQAIDTVASNYTHVKNLTPNTSYDFSVVAVDASGNVSNASNSITVVTLADTVAPSAPGGLSSSNVTFNSVNLTWQQAFDNVGVVGYNIYANNQLIDSVGTTTNKVVTGLTSNTNYQFYVKAKDAAGNLSQQSNNRYVNTPDMYCTANSGSTQHMYIDGVELNTISNQSGPGNGYSDFTNISTYLPKGVNHTINIYPKWPSTVYNMGYTVWIDYNFNGVFETYERILIQSSTNANLITQTFTVPGNAVEDTTLRMRIIAQYNATPTSACGTFNHGEVEDYTVIVGPYDSIAPSLPNSLTASNVSYTDLDLNWNAGSDNVGIVGYDIYKDGQLFKTVSDTSDNLTGLDDNTTYEFYVQAKDAVGNLSTTTDTITVTTLSDTIAPTAPDSILAFNIGHASLDLAWSVATDNNYVLGYLVYQDNQFLDSVHYNGTGINISGLTPSTTYQFYVQAYDVSGNVSVSTDTVTVTTLADSIPPSMSSYISYNNLTFKSLTLVWNNGNDNVGIVYYDVYQNGQLIDSTTSTNYNVNGLSAKTTYNFYVTARDAAGNESNPTNTLTITTPDKYCASKSNSTSYMYINKFELADIDNLSGAGPGYSDFTNQTAYLPKGITHSLTLTKAGGYSLGHAIWIDYNDDGFFSSSERVWYRNSNSSNTNVGSFIVPETAVEDTLRMRVASKYNGVPTACETFSHGEVEDYSVVIGIFDSIPPSQPTNLTANNVQYTTLTLDWDTASDNVGIVGYEVYVDNQLLTTVNDTTLNITGLTSGTTYEFFVIAKDLMGNASVSSDTITVTTLTDSIAPSVPTLTLDSLGYTELVLGWSQSTDNDTVIQYNIYMDHQLLDSAMFEYLFVNGLSPSTQYLFYVEAVDASGNVSDTSNNLLVTTPDDTIPPSAPYGLSTYNVQAYSIGLNWNGGFDNVGVKDYLIFVDGVLVDSTVAQNKVIGNLSPKTTYDFNVVTRDLAGNLSSSSPTLQATTIDNYCNTGSNNTSLMRIAKVELNTINNATSSSPNGYGDYTHISTELAKGLTHTIKITPYRSSSSYSLGYGVWIDYNNDGTFSTSERVWYKSPSTSSSVTGYFSIPSSAVEDSLRMRVAARYSGTPGPCQIHSYGEVEDYTVHILPMDTIAPSKPLGLAASNVAATTLDVDWNASTDNVGVFEYDVFLDGSSFLTTTDTLINVTGLTPNTTYEFTVQARDLTGNISVLSDTLTVSTLGDTVAPKTPTNLYASNVLYTSATLAWDATIDNVGVTGYQVIQDGIVVDSTSNTSISIYGLSQNTSYTFEVKAYDAVGNLSNASLPLTIKTLDVLCTSSGASTSDEYINIVTLNTINNTSGNNSGYGDFTNQVTTLTKGVSYTIEVTPEWPGSIYNEGYAAWIDYDANGSFDASELVWSLSPSPTSPAVGNFTIPTSSVEDTLRLRVSMKYGGVPGPCEHFDYGEVEDYTVVVVANSNPCAGSTLTADAGQDQYITIGDTVTLGGNPTASGGAAPYSFTWNDGSTSPSFTANPAADQTYYVTVVDDNGCVALDSVNVFVDTTTANCYGADIFISEYVEGTGWNKALEIFNPTPDTIDLFSENVVLDFFTNGSNQISSSLDLNGTLVPGGTFVIVHPSADSALLSLADQISGKINFTGDDAIALWRISGVVDQIGVIGQDPGTGWADSSGAVRTANNVLRRHDYLTAGDSSFVSYVTSDYWVAVSQSDYSNIGMHSIDCSSGSGAFKTTVPVVESLQITSKVYPNPVSAQNGRVQLAIEANKESMMDINLIGISGQLARTYPSEYITSGANVIELNLEGLSKGMYIIRLQNTEMVQNLTVILN